MMPKFYLFPLLFLPLLAGMHTLHAQCGVSAVVKQISCFGMNDGSVDLTVTNGSAPYVWAWSKNGTPQPVLEAPDNTFVIAGLSPGTYVFTVTDNVGCTAIVAPAITITQPAALEIAAFSLVQPCAGEFSGKLKLDVTNGQAAPYGLSWTNGINSGSKSNIPGEPFTVSGLGTGNYTVTITNANGCTATTTATLSSAAPLNLSTIVTNASCFNSNNGSIDLTVTGGTPVYSYAWANGTTTQDITNLSPGVYTVTVTDLSGCSATTSATVGQPTRIVITDVTQAACFGTNNGSIDLTVTGGTPTGIFPSPPTYDYVWTNSVTTQDQTGLSAGNYGVTVTDGLGCTATAEITVQHSAPLQASATVTAPSTCTANDGSIVLSAPNGTAPYTFNWSNGTLSGAGPGLTLSGLNPGVYTVTLTDGRGCTATLAAAQTTPMSVTATTTANILCSEQKGQIQVSVSGQSGTIFNYTWRRGSLTDTGSSGTPDFTISNLFSGNYTVEVRDDAGCFATVQANIGQGTSNLNAIATTTPTTCGYENGSAIVSVTGGMPVFGFTWSSGQTTPTAGGLAAGTYTVTVTEAGTGCTTTASATVGPSSGISGMTATPVTASCNGFNGGIVLTATGLVPPFTYSWTDGFFSGNGSSTTLPFTIANLNAGTYTVTIVKGNCFATATATVPTAGPSSTVSATATPPSNCSVPDGFIDLNISGGTQPFAYSWSGGNQTGNGSGIASNTIHITGLAPGWHSITLTDGVGCMTFTGAEVKNPASFQLSTVGISPTSCTGNNGEILVETTGGSAPYSYQWWHNSQQGQGSNIAASPFSIPNLAAGDYYLTVKSGGCAVVEPQLVIPQPVMVMTSFTVTPASCGGNNGNVDLSVTGGSAPYVYDWANMSGNNNPQDLTNVPPGVYIVTVSESAGCSSSSTVEVSGSLKLNLSSVSTPATTCKATNGAIQLNVSGGTPPFLYDWSHLPGANDPQDPTGLMPGTYVVTVTDALNCTAIRTVVVSSPLLQVLATVTNGSCNGLPSGIIMIDFTNAAGAVPPYSYEWTAPNAMTGSGSNIADEPFLITGLINAPYNITVTNGEGCTRVLNATVFQGANINISTTVTPVSCFGGNDGCVTLTATGGNPPYMFSWRNAQTGALVSTGQSPCNLSAGTYNVTITDAAGCTRAGNPVTVSSPVPIIVQGVAQPVTCFGGSDGAIVLTATGGTSPHTVQWSGPNGYTGIGFSISNLTGGLYTPTITDAKGCTQIGQPVNVQTPVTQVFFTGPQISYVNCNVVILDATINISNQTFTYLWSTGDVSPILTAPSVPGIFTVTVTNITCGTTNVKTTEVKPCGQIAGSVLSDENKNCVNDADPGLNSWIVKAEGAQTYFGTSQADGSYNIQVEPGHLYTVSAVAPNSTWIACLPTNDVLVSQPFDSVAGGDFLFKKRTECPMLTIDLTSGNLRRCFSNNHYSLLYCNEGTAAALNAYIIVTLDAALSVVSTSVPYTNLGNNQYRFNVGTVAVGQCGTIHLFLKLDCNAPVGATHCSEAHIYPDTLCEPPNLQWSGASLRVRSECKADSVHFVLKNIGTGNMTKGLEYVVIEDVVMMMKAQVQLNAGDSTVVKVPARGTTWRMEIEQEPFHPGLSRPASTVEGCGASTTFSTGFVNVFAPDDADKFIDIDCRQNTAPYDPNDKQAVPTGYGAAHYVNPNTPLEYTIRFQNTGNDTAFTVVLRDTLSAWLNPATVRPGASSHPYTWDLSGTGNLTFTFENILLPDTATNLDASHGFVKYRISPKDSVPLESVVLNRAAIYFDFNPPIITNETVHTLGKNFIVSNTWQPVQALYRVQVSPNPMGDEARLEVLGLPDYFGDFRLQVFDLQGKNVRELSSATPLFVLKKDNLPAGMYFFRVLADGNLVGSGKLIAEH